MEADSTLWDEYSRYLNSFPNFLMASADPVTESLGGLIQSTTDGSVSIVHFSFRDGKENIFKLGNGIPLNLATINGMTLATIQVSEGLYQLVQASSEPEVRIFNINTEDDVVFAMPIDKNKIVIVTSEARIGIYENGSVVLWRAYVEKNSTLVSVVHTEGSYWYNWITPGNGFFFMRLGESLDLLESDYSLVVPSANSQVGVCRQFKKNSHSSFLQASMSDNCYIELELSGTEVPLFYDSERHLVLLWTKHGMRGTCLIKSMLSGAVVDATSLNLDAVPVGWLESEREIVFGCVDESNAVCMYRGDNRICTLSGPNKNSSNYIFSVHYDAFEFQGISYPWCSIEPVGQDPKATVVCFHGGPFSGWLRKHHPVIDMFLVFGLRVVLFNGPGSVGWGERVRDAIMGRMGDLDVLIADSFIRHHKIMFGVNLAIYGESYGAFLGYKIATRNTNDISWCVLVSPFSEPSDPRFRPNKLRNQLKALASPKSPVEVTKNISASRAVIVYGSEDEIVPKEMSIDVVKSFLRAGSSVIQIPVEGGQHNPLQGRLDAIKRLFGAVNYFIANSSDVNY